MAHSSILLSIKQANVAAQHTQVYFADHVLAGCKAGVFMLCCVALPAVSGIETNFAKRGCTVISLDQLFMQLHVILQVDYQGGRAPPLKGLGAPRPPPASYASDMQTKNVPKFIDGYTVDQIFS